MGTNVNYIRDQSGPFLYNASIFEKSVVIVQMKRMSLSGASNKALNLQNAYFLKLKSLELLFNWEPETILRRFFAQFNTFFSATFIEINFKLTEISKISIEQSF